MLKISAFYLEKQKSFDPKKKICAMLVIETLKNKISDFLNSNTCFCLRLYGIYKNWEANLESAYSFMLKYCKITVWGAIYGQKYIILEQSDWSQAGCLNTANFSHLPGRIGL